MSDLEGDELETRAALDALEAYVERFRTEYGDACRLRPANAFTAQFLISALVRLLIRHEKGNMRSVRAHVETAVCSAEVEVFGEVRS